MVRAPRTQKSFAQRSKRGRACSSAVGPNGPDPEDGSDLVPARRLKAHRDARLTGGQPGRQRVRHIVKARDAALREGLFGDTLVVDGDLERPRATIVAVVGDDERGRG